MSKYSKLQLKIMAEIVLEARDNGDFRYSSLIVSIMVVTGLPEH